jgi:hypothetical protein
MVQVVALARRLRFGVPCSKFRSPTLNFELLNFEPPSGELLLEINAIAVIP